MSYAAQVWSRDGDPVLQSKPVSDDVARWLSVKLDLPHGQWVGAADLDPAWFAELRVLDPALDLDPKCDWLIVTIDDEENR